MLHKTRETELTQKQLHLMFVSIAIIILGLLFWICFVLTTVFLDCRLPDEFWSSKHTELFSVQAMFSVALFLLFILNLTVYFSTKKSKIYKETFVTGLICIANAVVITTIGMVLLQQVWFNHQNREIRQLKVSERDFSGDRCVRLMPFLGKWKIIEDKQKNSHFNEYIIFSDDLEVRTNNPHWDSYYFGINHFDKYTETPKSHRAVVSKEFTSSETLRGVLNLVYEVCGEKLCQGHEENWYFEKLGNELILIKVESNIQVNLNDWVLSDEIIRLRRNSK